MSAGAYVLVVFGILLAKCIGFLRDVMFAGIFGATQHTDIYFQVFGIASLVFTAIGGALSTLLIKNLNKPENAMPERKREYVSHFITRTTLLMLLVTAVLYLMAGSIVKIILPGLAEEFFGDAVKFMYIMLPSCVFVTIAYIMSGVLQNSKVFFISSIMSLPFNVIIIISLLIKNVDIMTVGIVTTIGWFLHIVIQLPSFYKKGFKLFSVKKPEGLSKERNIEVLYIFISSMMFQACLIIDKAFVSFDSGAATTINYASNLFITVASVFVVAMSNVAYPSLCRNYEAKNDEFVKQIMRYIITVLFAIFIPFILAVSCFGENIISLVYERGEFTGELTQMTASLFMVYVLGIFGYVCQELFNKVLYLGNGYKYTVIGTLCVVVLKPVINFFVMPIGGVMAVAISTTVLFSLYAVNVALSMVKVIGNYVNKSLVVNILKILIAGVLALAVFAVCKVFMPSMFEGKTGFVIPLGICGVVYVAVLLVTGILKVVIQKGSLPESEGEPEKKEIEEDPQKAKKRSKRRIFAVICVVAISMGAIVPSLCTRISNEKANSHVVVAVNYDEKSSQALDEYKKSGVRAAVIDEQYLEEIDKAKNAGLEPVISIDACKYIKKDKADFIEKTIKDYGIRYIILYGEPEGESFGDKADLGRMCGIIKDNNLTLVLTETRTQLSNEKVAGYDEYVKSAEGRVMRLYKTDKRNSLNRADYDLIYYQMLNSLVDRNIRFFAVNTIEDTAYSAEENLRRTLRATERFTNRISDMGYSFEGRADLSHYNVDKRPVLMASVALMSVMALLMAVWIFGNKKIFDRIAAVFGAAFVAASWFVPESLVWVYPTLYSVVAPCFAITAVCAFVFKSREKLSSFKLAISSVVLSVGLLCISVLMLCALLSGAEYYINSSVFRGVKLSLVVPIVYSVWLFLFAKSGKEGIELKTIAELKKQYFKKKYVITAIISFVVIAIVAVIYVIRSGNTMLPFSEVYLRNAITDVLLARPRTKEFILAWPAFVLFICFAKKYPDGILQWIFGSVCSLLFASVINTFCHVFTSVDIMYLRVLHGMWMSVPAVIVAVLISFAVIKTINKVKNK